MHDLVFLHHASNPNGRVPDFSDEVPLPIAVVPEWCQKHLAQTPEHSLLPRIWHTYAESERVTDGARTRDLRSHNPMLYLLSYGHHARMGFYQRKDAWQSAVCARFLYRAGSK